MPEGSVIRLLTRPSGWSRIKLFGASSRAPYSRHRADAVSLILHVIALVAVMPTTRKLNGFEANLARAVDSLPTIVAPIASVPYDLLAVWAVVVLVLTAVRGHVRLLIGLLATIPVGLLATALANQVVDPDAANNGLALGAAQDGLPVQLVLALGVATVASRELSRPFRTFSRRLGIAAALCAVLLPASSPYRVVCAVLVAGAVAAAVRLVFGSPAGSVSADDLRLGLGDLGVSADPVGAAIGGTTDAVLADGGRLVVAVKGRDERESQLFATVWRFVWYRNSGNNLILSNRQQIEHQALLMLLADARGAPVTPVVAAGTSRTGDAILAARVDGVPVDELGAAEVEALLPAMWRALHELHEAGVAHGTIDGAVVLADPDGTVRLGGFARAQPITDVSQVHADHAQLLITTALLVGEEPAVAAALAAVDPDAVAPLVAHLQAPAVDSRLRKAVDQADLELEHLRTATAERAGIEVPELQKIWRVSWGAVLRLAVLGFVGYLLISQLADIGLSTIADAIRDAELPVLLFALVLGQSPRVATAASLQAASPAPVPLERVTRLQFAITFINLAMPSTAARAATSIRFFQRSGATPGGAVSAGALDSVSGFIAQIALLGGFLLFGFGTLGFDQLPDGTSDRSGLWTGVAVVVGLLVVAVVVVLCVPRLRHLVFGFLGQLREALTVLRSPSAVVRLLAFNLLAELLFSLTIWVVLQAFGQSVDIADVIIINEAVALFAGLIPVPGGVGVTEGALTAGFVAVGVPDEIAFSAALSYRMCTFYLPPIWGYVAFRSLRKDRYL
jgi:uncharacterized membrane protein YbhN (UPF0104 family)